TGGSAAGQQARPVPVVVTPVRIGDLSVYLTALGTVTPLNTVTVKSRVDGQLMATHFTEGQVVHAGDVLAEIDPRPFQAQLTQAEGQLARDQANLANTRLDLERYQRLAQQEMIAQQQLDTQRMIVNQAEASIKMNVGQIDAIKLQLTYCRITAPITGRVGLRLVDPGNVVKAADTGGLVVITQLEPIALVFSVPEDSLQPILRHLRAGTKVPVDAFDREGRTKIAAGTLVAIDNQIDPATGTVRLKASFGNMDGVLYPNQFVNARVLIDVLHDAVLAPAEAIVLAGIVAYRQLPVAALPQVDYPTIQIVTFYPGASPDVMASGVTAPLERQFGQLPGLKQMTSISSSGSSIVTLQFDLALSIDVAEQQVQAAINAATTFLPRDLPNPPVYSKVNPADAPVLT